LSQVAAIDQYKAIFPEDLVAFNTHTERVNTDGIILGPDAMGYSRSKLPQGFGATGTKKLNFSLAEIAFELKTKREHDPFVDPFGPLHFDKHNPPFHISTPTSTIEAAFNNRSRLAVITLQGATGD
jgi:hypothetical protein